MVKDLSCLPESTPAVALSSWADIFLKPATCLDDSIPEWPYSEMIIEIRVMEIHYWTKEGTKPLGKTKF